MISSEGFRLGEVISTWSDVSSPIVTGTFTAVMESVIFMIQKSDWVSSLRIAAFGSISTFDFDFLLNLTVATRFSGMEEMPGTLITYDWVCEAGSTAGIDDATTPLY